MKINLTEREIDIIDRYRQTLKSLTKGEVNLTIRQSLSCLLNYVKEKLDENIVEKDYE